MTCALHEFAILSGVFVCRKCGLRLDPPTRPVDRDPEKPVKPLKGQKKLPFKAGETK